jgi:hypothetical protein
MKVHARNIHTGKAVCGSIFGEPKNTTNAVQEISCGYCLNHIYNDTVPVAVDAPFTQTSPKWLHVLAGWRDQTVEMSNEPETVRDLISLLQEINPDGNAPVALYSTGGGIQVVRSDDDGRVYFMEP